MKNHTSILVVGLAVISTAFVGCVSVHKVTIEDAPRHHVSFESAQAMQIFYDTLLAHHLPAGGKPSRVRVGETVYTREMRPSSNVAFNTGVAIADTDTNGVISTAEATSYALRKTK
jgi:hypothetical protein